MKKPLRLCRAFLLFLFLLPMKTRCFNDASSSLEKKLIPDESSTIFCNVRVKDSANYRKNGVSNLESIFGGASIENSNSMNVENVDGGRQSEDVEGQPDKSVRTKRNSLENRSPGSNSMSEEKGNEGSSRIVSRNGEGLAKIHDKASDYSDVSADEGSEQEEVENEDEGKSGYKSSEFKVGENGEKYIDQEERSSLYDDFEAKDVVKRGISGAEDYEELEEKDELLSEPSAMMENAAVGEGESTEEEIEGRRVRGNLRMKRNRDKGGLRAENFEKREVPSKSAKETKVVKRTANSPRRKTRDKVAKRDKEFANQEEQSKEDFVERDEAKVDSDLETDVGSASSNENSETQAADSNSVNEEGQEIGENKKDAKLSSELDNTVDVLKNENSLEDGQESGVEKKSAAKISTDQKSLSDLTNSGEESKIVGSQKNERQESETEKKSEAKRSNDEKVSSDSANLENQGSTRERKEVKLSNGDPKIFVEFINPSDTSKTSNSRIVEISSPDRNSKIDSSEQDSNIGVSKESDSENYEKRVEEEIQRKIDSIKEEIKREVERNRQIREIEENNAKFDEMRDREEEEEEGNPEGSKINEKRRSVSKRFVRSEAKSPEAREESKTEKRSAKRKKREEVANAEKVAESESNRRKESGEETEKKRAVETSMEADSKILPIKKRDYEREVILMRSDRGGGRKRRRKRRRRRVARNSVPAKVKTENLNFRGDVDKAASSVNVENEREETEGDSSGKRSDSVASLAGNSEDLDPRLATEYGEAFGGLQGEPGVALARFKRIKRVLQAPSAKT